MYVTHSSTLESVIDQWNDYLEKKSQLEQWMESVDQKVEHPLQLQPGLKEKFALLDHCQSVVSEAEDHVGALQQLTARSRELYSRTQDESFKEAGQEELRTQFQDITTVAKVSALDPGKSFRAQSMKCELSCCIWLVCNRVYVGWLIIFQKDGK